MTKKLFLGIPFFILILPTISLYAKDDWQYWNMIQLQAKTNDKLTMRVHGEQWLTENFSRVSLNNAEAGFLWRPVSFFESGPFYRYQHVDNLRGPNTNEHRYTLEGTLRFRSGNWEFSDRNRAEFRETNQRNFWVYRNQIRATHHFQFEKFTLSPFLSEELFHRGDGTGINENRVSAGWQTRFHKHFGVTLFFLVRHTKGKMDWKSDEALGSTFHIYIE